MKNITEFILEGVSKNNLEKIFRDYVGWQLKYIESTEVGEEGPEYHVDIYTIQCKDIPKNKCPQLHVETDLNEFWITDPSGYHAKYFYDNEEGYWTYDDRFPPSLDIHMKCNIITLKKVFSNENYKDFLDCYLTSIKSPQSK